MLSYEHFAEEVEFALSPCEGTAPPTAPKDEVRREEGSRTRDSGESQLIVVPFKKSYPRF